MNIKNRILFIIAIVLMVVIGVEVYFYKNHTYVSGQLMADSITVSKKKEAANGTNSKTVKPSTSTRAQVNGINTHKEIEKKTTWHGATSKNDVRKVIDGTTWETIEREPSTGLWLRFVIHGNSVDEYIAMNTLNYDDPKTWKLTVKWEIYGVYEPQQGLYCVALRGKEGTGIYEDVPVFISLKGESVFYSMADDHVFLKLVK